MKTKRKIIEIDEELCNGCGQCVSACAESALALVDGKARVVSDNLCDGLGACIGECPTGALKIVEREADEFDHSAVEMARRCPSSQVVVSFPSVVTSAESRPSTLSHWPVKIRLVPEGAPFLKGADLLVVADCVPVAFPDLHGKLLPGRTVMVGCPKFDETDAYVEKFAGIFRNAGLKRVTVAIMEVPCCSGLPRIVRRAMDLAGKNIPLDIVVISRQGKIIDEGKKLVCL
ncbi:4Fe-4S binding domain-containing protein [Syntrophus gentianae]|uniref:4Fe-4S binding domain-containing protein n=1 Tax=Syntrophus gentianae TaxID=43775 RepID=A0A1H7Z8F0_9BACT|nr:4Fe-4S binding protein [Syntrophus gentianae]SEM54503.1 4Fe-4S binding domain-containing protein [Syntrophus gentianae]